ncbi:PHOSPHOPANTOTHENOYLCYSTEINE DECARBOXYLASE SUBUNIT VHS3-LIKE ISOFORM X1 [Salix koriyanagi]|uniref:PHOSPHOPANTOTHENOYLCYSTEINE DECARBOXYLASE SUBUNIT VHS3-LIKE ISOFORM X1 n=1 Tax=Salix koriyanagi TaxID=2511006 RepID=A0A9Q0W113_9ROSI|nr:PHOSPHOPANTOTHENOYLCYSTEINE DECARBOXYLASE SUBUNIT VHS3-LIKE ISOFORM X1 [Salix koriyanagi]
MEGLVCSNAVVVEGFLSSIIETVVLETAIAAWKAFALSLFMIGSLPNGFDDFPEESGTSQGFPFTGLHIRKKPDPDNQDASDTDDDEDNEDGQDDQDDDDDEGEDDEGDDDDVPDKGKDGEDPVEVPEANGDGIPQPPSKKRK